MKKYLMMGIAILALASCTKHDIEYVNPDVVKYEQVFTERFGTPSPTHTWGFGSGITRGANTNKNQWGNPNYGNWQIPPVLTEKQKNRVRAYFQQNPYLTFEAPSYENYFVQQVYKGGTNTPESSLSLEYYYASNNDTIDASGHMDLLTVGEGDALAHVNNFNYGNYNFGVGHDVLNTGATDESNSANFHKDMITLMEGPVPTCVGYHETVGQIQHNDHAALVSAAVIDAWAEANKSTLSEEDYGEAVDDEWERDFVGLDYESQPLENVLVKNDDGTQKYAKVSDYNVYKDYVWTGTTIVKYEDVKDQLLLTAYNKNVPVVSINMNEYLGQGVEIQQNELIKKVTGKQLHDAGISTDDQSETREYDALDLAKVYELLGTNGYAVNGSNTKFVKNIGGRDYVFSDWIVTLTPAKKQNTEKYDYRVMAEDLSTNENSDFDFNDVVFDVKYVSSTKAKVKVRAAGGIYPIRIDGKDNYEIHALLGGGMTMTNTYPGRHYEYDAETFEVSGSFGSSAADPAFKAGVGAIKIEVNKGNGYTELTAPTGKVASKIGVPVDVDWCDEYQDIDEKWGTGAFAAWVADESNPFWTNKTQWNQ